MQAGGSPSARYETLTVRFRPAFAEIRATAVARDGARRLSHAEIGWLQEAGFTTLRLAEGAGEHGASLPALFNLLIERSQWAAASLRPGTPRSASSRP